MSRQIKFRVWDNTNRLMLYPYDGYMFPGDTIGTDHTGVKASLFKRRELVFLQHTGLKDKGGKEIYEGDIIAGFPDGTVWVKWDDIYACWAAAWDEEFDDQDGETRIREMTDLLQNHMENCGMNQSVVGNVHENPELLTP